MGAHTTALRSRTVVAAGAVALAVGAVATGPNRAAATSVSIPLRTAALTVGADRGPAFFPVDHSAGAVPASRFATVVASALGPAVRLTRPGGIWAAHHVAVLWLSHVALRLEQHPGVKTSYSHVADPGASPRWTTSPVLSRSLQLRLAATFNGGFKVVNGDSHGGYWDSGYGIDGRGRVLHDPAGTSVLHRGVMSLVVYRDGSWDVGRWGTEVRMSPRVRFVRQELAPLVDGRAINPLTRSSNCQGVWGKTVSIPRCTPWRSGVGVTASGDLVYVSGDRLTPLQLAVLLRDAGAVRAMQLDVNRQWISAEYYRPGTATRPAVPHVVNSPYYSPAHYVSGSVAAGTASNRDFFAAYLR
jgi:hypothetical protein